MALSKVVDVIKDKCQNCHACITACPSKFCNDGSGNYVEINHDLCIGCGQCIDACTWGARVIVDDSEDFFNDLKNKVKMIAIVAPSIAASFPNTYLNLNGWFKQIGIEAVFDVSFGAELTIKSYLEHIKHNNPKTVISQPCPAIVSYIELYRPELLEYLAPADSPMLHGIKMIKEFYPEYANHKVAVISPCIAKKREFEATGFGDYNVTFTKLQEYLNSHRVRLTDFQKVAYNNPPAERAVLFSTPGGLLETAARWNSQIRSKIRKIEGPHTIYHYLDNLEKDVNLKYAPLIVDCLNCEKGCNGGTGTDCRNLSMDYLESLIEKRKTDMQKEYLSTQECIAANNGSINELEKDEIIQDKINELIEKFWKPGLYDRKYCNRSNTNIKVKLSEYEFDKIYKLLLKDSPKDHKNCPACGYGSCKNMAIAIYNGLNKPENCHYYQSKLLLKDSAIRQDAMLKFRDVVINQFGAEDSMSRFTPIIKAIENISMQTSILSINASIEAAHAGDAGRGFAVVAQSIGTLAGKTREETTKIQDSLGELQEILDGAINEFEQRFKS